MNFVQAFTGTCISKGKELAVCREAARTKLSMSAMKIVTLSVDMGQGCILLPPYVKKYPRH